MSVFELLPFLHKLYVERPHIQATETYRWQNLKTAFYYNFSRKVNLIYVCKSTLFGCLSELI